MTDRPRDGENDNVWALLRRSKVVQWSIAYVAGAWGLLQGFAYLSSVFGWPSVLQRPVTTALLIGLPIALVLAWYRGDRVHQRGSGREFAILKRQVAIQNDVRRARGSWVVEEREFLLIRNQLARFPAAVRAIALTAAELHRSVDTLRVCDFAQRC